MLSYPKNELPFVDKFDIFSKFHMIYVFWLTETPVGSSFLWDLL